jgi:hypothetical protein
MNPRTDFFLQQCLEQKSITDYLNVVFRVAQSLEYKLYIIIDEYDHFANDLIAMGSSRGDEVYDRTIHANGVVRDFYETLKAGSKTVIDRILLTGITPIMLDDMTSGFNIANNISIKPKYNEILGFTQAEVDKMIDDLGIDRSLINVNMEYFYNGYKFHVKGEHRVYNSSMVLFYFTQILENNSTPDYLIDDNLKTDYGRLRRLIQTKENRHQLVEIAKNNFIGGTVIPKFSLEQLTESECFTSLLFYMGLLTIDTDMPGRTQLRIPNYSTRMLYWEYLVKLTKDRNSDILIDMSRLADSMYMLTYQNDPKPFIDYISQNIVSRLSFRDLEKFDEKYLKIILLNNLFYNTYYIPLSETEVTYGYTDIYLQRSRKYPDIPNEWILEIKYHY